MVRLGSRWTQDVFPCSERGDVFLFSFLYVVIPVSWSWASF